MEKDKIFFGDNGLTTTSANHIANLCKEAYQGLEGKLNFQFYTTQVGLLSSSVTKTLREGTPDWVVESARSILEQIIDFKSLIAWLREAIKAKDRLISEASKMKDSDIAEMLGITIPDIPYSYTRLTQDDVIATWNIKERNRYYYLDTYCAVVGSFIHPNGTFSEAKANLIKVLSEPHRLVGDGMNSILHTYIPTVQLDDVESTFFELQESYRAKQAELNSMKHCIELALQEDDREKSQKEREELEAYKSEQRVVTSKIEERRKEMVREAQALKIIIPDSLKGTYESISKIGK